MDGLSWKTPIKMDDLGVPLFSETPYMTNPFLRPMLTMNQKKPQKVT